MRHVLQIKLALLGMILYSGSFTLARVYLDHRNKTENRQVTVRNVNQAKIVWASASSPITNEETTSIEE